MTGGSNPILRQTDSIRGLRAGLAICLQFQVRRYSTPLTAATAICRASVAAFGGSGTSSSDAAASYSASVVTSNSGTSASTRRRSAAATESPAAHSPTTNRETYTEKRWRCPVHHSCVVCWLAAIRRTPLGCIAR